MFELHVPTSGFSSKSFEKATCRHVIIWGMIIKLAIEEHTFELSDTFFIIPTTSHCII